MKSGRFFVTFVCLMTTAVLMACEAFRTASHTPGQPQASHQPQTAQTVEAAAAEANAKLEQIGALEAEMVGRYLFNFESIHDLQGRRVKVEIMAMDYNWRRLSKAERTLAKQRLAQYLSMVNEILEMDARRGLYLTRKQQVLSRRDAAVSYQRSLENFEKIFGENYEAKPGAKSEPPYVKGTDA